MQTTMHTFVWENIWDLVTMAIMQRPLNPVDRNTVSTVVDQMKCYMAITVCLYLTTV